MIRRWFLLFVPFLVVGCTTTAEHLLNYVILPEQRQLAIRDPSQLPPANLPPLPPPRTVTAPQDDLPEWKLSLDEALKIALINAQVIRVLAGVNATTSGRTIYDAAIANTNIDQEQARFDPNFTETLNLSRNENAQAVLNFFDPGTSRVQGNSTDIFSSQMGFSKTNVLGGQWQLNWNKSTTRFDALPALGQPFALNPETRGDLDLSYTQPLWQGGGLALNLAPVVIARIDTERSFFQTKDTAQEMVRGVIEAYWTLVAARTDVWARKIQLEQSEEAFNREQARFKVGLANAADVAQTRVTFQNFKADLITAEALVLAREGALRNIMGVPPSDNKRIVPISAPKSERLRPDWNKLLKLAEQLRPDVIELKLVIEADQQRLIQAQNVNMPRLDLTGLYRWNGLSGEMPNGGRLATEFGEYNDWSVSVNFSVPLGLRQGRARVRQQELILARDRANLEQSLHQTAHDLAITLRNLDAAYETYLIYKQTREAALTNLRAQTAQFRIGRTIFLNVLQAINDWGRSVSSEARALIDYNVALAVLERQTGIILEAHGLVFWEERFRAAGPLGICGHDELYPAATAPVGEPKRYPGTKEPSENTFDLQRPDGGRDRKKDDRELPEPRQEDPQLPAPRKEEKPIPEAVAPPATLPLPDDGWRQGVPRKSK